MDILNLNHFFCVVLDRMPQSLSEIKLCVTMSDLRLPSSWVEMFDYGEEVLTINRNVYSSGGMLYNIYSLAEELVLYDIEAIFRKK